MSFGLDKHTMQSLLLILQLYVISIKVFAIVSYYEGTRTKGRQQPSMHHRITHLIKRDRHAGEGFIVFRNMTLYNAVTLNTANTQTLKAFKLMFV